MTQSNITPIPELYVNADSAQKLKVAAGEMPSWDLTPVSYTHLRAHET